MESSVGANNYVGQFKVSRGHPRSNDVPLLYRIEIWWVESSSGANNLIKVIRSHPRSNPYSFSYGSETWLMGMRKMFEVSSRSSGSTKVKSV